MEDNPNSDEDVPSRQRTKKVELRDWWLIKCPEEFQGKRFGVAGTQIAETGAVRVFTSSPIIKAIDVFTLEASDGVCIILRGFLDKQRLAQSGFLPQISRDFIFGFPPCWESKCNHCFVGGVPSEAPINKASRTLLSPCKNTKWNLEDSPAERRRGESTVVEKNTEEETTNDDKVGRCSTARRDETHARKKSLRLQSKSVEVKNKTTNHGSEGLSKAKSSGVEKDELINREVISPADKVTSMIATEESQGKGVELEATKKACPRSLFEDLEEKSGKKAASKKSGRVLRSDGNVVVVEHVNHSGTKVKRKLDVSEVEKNPTTNDVGHGAKKITSKNAREESPTSEQRKGKLKVTETSLRDSSSKLGKSGKSKKKSEEILTGGDLDVVSVEPMTHSRSKVKDNLSVGKTIRKIDFDEEVTPEKDAKKQKTNYAIVASPDSLGQKRSRSGRVLVSPLEYWRNQLPVYDADRNLIQVKEGHQSNSTPPSKGKGSVSRKPRR